jgi:NDP-sugar pyrophosphorylase family protein
MFNPGMFGVSPQQAEQAREVGEHMGMQIIKHRKEGRLEVKFYLLNPGESFFVANCDDIKEADLYDMRRFHEDNGAYATMALTKVSDASQFGVAVMDGRRIREFIEKPREAEAGLINTGLYLFEPKVLEFIPNYGKPMLEKAVFPKLALRGKLFGYPLSGRWLTVNTLEQYQAAEKMLRS